MHFSRQPSFRATTESTHPSTPPPPPPRDCVSGQGSPPFFAGDPRVFAKHPSLEGSCGCVEKCGANARNVGHSEDDVGREHSDIRCLTNDGAEKARFLHCNQEMWNAFGIIPRCRSFITMSARRDKERDVRDRNDARTRSLCFVEETTLAGTVQCDWGSNYSAAKWRFLDRYMLVLSETRPSRFHRGKRFIWVKIYYRLYKVCNTPSGFRASRSFTDLTRNKSSEGSSGRNVLLHSSRLQIMPCEFSVLLVVKKAVNCVFDHLFIHRQNKYA